MFNECMVVSIRVKERFFIEYESNSLEGDLFDVRYVSTCNEKYIFRIPL